MSFSVDRQDRFGGALSLCFFLFARRFEQMTRARGRYKEGKIKKETQKQISRARKEEDGE